MSFFKSEIVRAEMAEISILQEDIYRNLLSFYTMSIEEKKFHISLIEKLLNKQKILFTRLSLSDDPEAIEMKARITETAKNIGLPQDVPINSIFDNMEKLIDIMKNELDNSKEIN